MSSIRPLVVVIVCSLGFIACGGSSSTAGASSDDAGATSDATDNDAAAGDDASSDSSAAVDGGNTDGTPTRQQCTATLGNALTTSFGRLDGYLVSIVHLSQSSCHGDSSHVHLQVAANNATYDVAVNVDGIFHQQNAALGGAPWTEGWHPGVANSYAAMGVHSSAFASSNPNALATTVESALANANHISIYATGYGPTGVHLVHFQRGRDGMIVIDPLGPTSHALMFAFQGDSF